MYSLGINFKRTKFHNIILIIYLYQARIVTIIHKNVVIY